MDCSPPGSSFQGFSRQEYWSGLPWPPPGDLPDPGIESVSLMSPALAGRFFTTSATWEAQMQTTTYKIDQKQDPIVLLRKLYSISCDKLSWKRI